MSAIKKLVLANLEATKARLSEGRQWIGIKNLEAPDEVQPRAGIDKDWVSQLATFRREGSEFPPARVYQLPDGKLILAEGHHRRWALLGENEADMLCEVVDGTMEEAIVYATGSNKSNGVKPMSHKDIDKALDMLFEIERWWQSSTERVAKHVGCSKQKVATRRQRYSEAHKSLIPEKTLGTDGSRQPTKKTRVGSRDVKITQRRSGQWCCYYHNHEYRYMDENELKNKMKEVFAQEDKFKKAISYEALRGRLASKGFKSTFANNEVSGLRGWHGHGIAVVPCKIKGRDSVFEAVGNVSAVLSAVGRIQASRHCNKTLTRSVILCAKELLPPLLIGLFEESGIEFMTPDELISSLGPVIPEELVSESNNS